MARRILIFKKVGNDIEVNYNLSSTEVEKGNLSRVIYKILSLYELDLPLKKKNQSTFIIEGLGNVEYHQSVMEDIYDEYVDWYAYNRTSLSQSITDKESERTRSKY